MNREARNPGNPTRITLRSIRLRTGYAGLSNTINSTSVRFLYFIPAEAVAMTLAENCCAS